MSDYIIIKQKINNTNIQDTLVVIPTLMNVVANDYFRKRVTCQLKRFIFNFCLFTEIGRAHV